MINNKNDIENFLNDKKLGKKLSVNSNNFNNEAYLCRWHNDQYVVRKIGRQYNLSAKQLVVLEKDIRIYYKLLKKLIPANIPKIFFTKIDKKQNSILLVTEYFTKGKIVEVRDVSKKVKYFKSISKLIITLASSKRNINLNKLICSIDPNPENFFIDFKNKFIYNDFTPPLYRKNGKWSEFRRQDEMYAKKFNKERRYFTGFNLLLVFVNKTRIYLSFFDYLKFIKWICNEINKSRLLNNNNIKEFPRVFTDLYTKKVVNLNKFKKYAVSRDLLRFNLSFREDLTSDQLKEIYKESKKFDNVLYLEKKIKKYDKLK